MKTTEFIDQYLPATKMKATWRDKDNNVGSGLLLDSFTTSIAGIPMVYIDSFSQRIPVADLLRIESLGVDWTMGYSKGRMRDL